MTKTKTKTKTKNNNNYLLISTFDGNDTIEFEVAKGENAEERALEELGWFITCSEDSEE
jgi:hypothetical protein